MSNLYKQLLGLFPEQPLQVGTVLDVDQGIATIELPGGGRIQGRGAAAIGDQVYVRDGVIEAIAAPLAFAILEI